MLQRPLAKNNIVQIQWRMHFESFFPAVSDGFELIQSPYYLVPYKQMAYLQDSWMALETWAMAMKQSNFRNAS